eukprot:Seg200.3 transcript_id=Seg200.3/GoldUCD/mRNA.D3Y31 product="Cholecystokinin receptor type A" protein_id=Seg200.3/GoldUCD/D3Y31
MTNITKGSSSSSAMKLFEAGWSYIIISLIIGTAAIILNSTEIRLIWRKWRKATDFEILLFHLAISDLLNAIYSLAFTSLLIFYHVTKSFNEALLWVEAGLGGFFYLVSIKLVVVIGLERLLAIKLPLKHRLWHTNRKTMYIQICASWCLSAVVMSATVLTDYFIQSFKVQKAKGQHNTGQNNTSHSVEGQRVLVSRNVGYAVAAYVSGGVLAIMIIYPLVCNTVVRLAVNRLKFDNKDYKKDPKLIKLAMKKEKATIVICRIVFVTFLACNVPLAVGLYRGTVDEISRNLVNLSTVANPLIYFFKGYIEKCYGRRKIVLSSTHSGDRARGTKNKSESLSSKLGTSDTAEEVEIGEKEANGGLTKHTDQEAKGSWGKSQGSLPLQLNSDTSEELGLVNEDENLDMPKYIDKEFRMSKVKGEVALSVQPEAIITFEMGFVNAAATVNTSI